MVRTTNLNNYSDVHYTRGDIAKLVVDHFSPTGRVLEPFKGGGAFTDHLPDDTLWCEKEEGFDFFDFKDSVDFIISNPPFSNLTEILSHAFSIADNVIFLLPVSKIYSSAPRLKLIRKYGGIKEQFYLGTGRECGFDIGFPFCAMHMQKDYKGPIYESWKD